MRAHNTRHPLFFSRRFRGWVRWITPVLVLLIGFHENAEGMSTLSPSLALSERYSDNFFFSEIEANREGDFTTMVGPQLTLTVNERNWNISARYEGTAEFHGRHPEENQYGQTLGVDLHLPFVSQRVRGLDVRITESVAYVPELPAFSFGRSGDPLSPEANQGIQVGRINTFRNRAGVTLGYGWTPLFSTALSYSHLINRYQGGALEDYVVHEGGLSGHYQASRNLQWRISYSSSLNDYEGADSVLAHRFDIGEHYQFSPTFRVNIGAGAALLPGDSTQWTLSAGIEKAGPFGSLSLQYNRGIGTGGGVTTTPTLTQNLVAEVTQALGRSASVSLRLGYGANEALSGSSMEISTQEVGIGMEVSLLSWLSGGVNYSYLNQRTEGGETDRGARRNMVLVTLTAAAPPLRIMQ
ncbi:MAG: hypothetical protein MPW16_17545 [Candidatus Manganitrophus sp.]|nr:MAG: hypothetical protein MPW16_17545 [Candidatus Manganitrophus sp.]